MERRVLTGKQQKPQGEVKERLKLEFQGIRDLYERQNLGNFELIFPPRDEEKMRFYQGIIEVSRQVWENQTGFKGRLRNRHESLDPNKPRPFIVPKKPTSTKNSLFLKEVASPQNSSSSNTKVNKMQKKVFSQTNGSQKLRHKRIMIREVSSLDGN